MSTNKQICYTARQIEVLKAILFDPNDLLLLKTLLSFILFKEVIDIKFFHPEKIQDNLINRTKVNRFLANVEGLPYCILFDNKKDIDEIKEYSRSYVKVKNISFKYNMGILPWPSMDITCNYARNYQHIYFNMDYIKKSYQEAPTPIAKVFFYYLSILDLTVEELEKEEKTNFTIKLQEKLKEVNQNQEFIKFLKTKKSRLL